MYKSLRECQQTIREHPEHVIYDYRCRADTKCMITLVLSSLYCGFKCLECARYLSAWLPPIDTYLQRRLLIDETHPAIFDPSFSRSNCIMHDRHIVDERGWFAEGHCKWCNDGNQKETKKFIGLALIIGEIMPRDLCWVIMRMAITYFFVLSQQAAKTAHIRSATSPIDRHHNPSAITFLC